MRDIPLIRHVILDDRRDTLEGSLRVCRIEVGLVIVTTNCGWIFISFSLCFRGRNMASSVSISIRNRQMLLVVSRLASQSTILVAPYTNNSVKVL